MVTRVTRVTRVSRVPVRDAHVDFICTTQKYDRS